MLASAKILGYVELKVGTLDIEVPIRAREAPLPVAAGAPLAMFEVEGDMYAIVVSSDSRSANMREAVEQAAEDALRHLSRKLLN
jgi:hypothetical protein